MIKFFSNNIFQTGNALVADKSESTGEQKHSTNPRQLLTNLINFLVDAQEKEKEEEEISSRLN